jgi:hypothetical protein
MPKQVFAQKAVQSTCADTGGFLKGWSSEGGRRHEEQDCTWRRSVVLSSGELPASGSVA